MAELYTTLGGSTLDGAINNAVTSLDVLSASSFPTSGTFRIRIDDEILKVTAVSGATFTVARGQEGTSAASHADVAVVTEVLTMESLDAIRADIHRTGLYSARPSASATGGAQGNVYLPSDAPIGFLANSGAWQGFGPHIFFTKPVLGDYSWRNQGSATATDAGDYIRMIGPASATPAFRALVKSYSTPKSFAIVASSWMCGNNYASVGIFLRDSATGRIILFGPDSQNAQFMEVSRHTGYTVFSAMGHQEIYRVNAPYLMLKVVDDGTSLYFKISIDGGAYWHQIHTETRATFLANPDEIGFAVNTQNSKEVLLNVYSIVEGTS
jgi:hypothetical protein